MNITRRDVLAGLTATLGAATLGAPTGPIELSQYFLQHWGAPVWEDRFAWSDLSPFLSAYRWHFDDQTYTTPLICCVHNARIFTVLTPRWPGEKAYTGVFELMIPGLTWKSGTKDQFSKPLAGAARYAATWASDFLPLRREKHRGAVYLDFAAGDLTSPVTTDAPPLIIHPWLSPSYWPDAEDDDDFEEDEVAAVSQGDVST